MDVHLLDFTTRADQNCKTNCPAYTCDTESRSLLCVRISSYTVTLLSSQKTHLLLLFSFFCTEYLCHVPPSFCSTLPPSLTVEVKVTRSFQGHFPLPTVAPGEMLGRSQ